MELHLVCIPCMQRQVLQAARLVTDEKELQEEILRKVLDELLNSDWKTRTTIMATRTREIITEITGNNDPYSEIKIKYNKLALDLYPDLEILVSNSNNPFLTALKLTIAGNIIDFGAPKTFDIKKTIAEVLDSPLTIDDSEYLLTTIKSAKNIMLLS